MSFITPIKFLRSLVYNKRPVAANLLEGQPAFNGNADQPGLFLKNSDNELTKVGPIHVGLIPPNSATDPNGAGDGTLSKGEGWLDESGIEGPNLKIWNGSQWVPSSPVTLYARVIISVVAPPVGPNPEGTLWWNPTPGTGMKILFESAWVNI